MEPEDLAPAILNGQYDTVIADVLEAIKIRDREGTIHLCWRFTYEDLVVDEDNITVAEALLVEQARGVAVQDLRVAATAHNAAAVLVAALMERKNMSIEDATKQVGALGATQMFKMISEYPDVNPPKDASAPATPDTSQPST